MSTLSIKISSDFNENSVAEEISQYLQEEGFEMRAIELRVNKNSIQVKSDLIHFDNRFLNTIEAATDGYRIGIELN